MHSPIPFTLLSTLLATSCATTSPAPEEPPDRSLSAIDRLINDRRSTGPSGASIETCIGRADSAGLCAPGARERRFALRLLLDQRYTEKWPRWQARLQQTLSCVNRLYTKTGVSFAVGTLLPFRPGVQRHQLYPLLARLQREHPPGGRELLLGITVWSERKVYGIKGGEIGLSQNGACVVPSWPRVENDCVILAHELGHLLGAKHLPGRRWIMGWAARPFYLPAKDPLLRVQATYRFHPRNVEAIRAHRSAHFGRRGQLVISAACAQRIASIDRCWRQGP